MSGTPSPSSSRSSSSTAPGRRGCAARARRPRATAAMSEPTRTAALTSSVSGGSPVKASSPISSETVKPMPASERQGEDVRPGQVLVELGPGEAGGQPGAAEDADGLADDQAEDDAEGLGPGEDRRRGRRRRRRRRRRRSANSGTARPAESGRTRCSMCSPGDCRSPGPGRCSGQHQAHRHAGDGGVDAAVVHQRPDDQGERHVDVPAAHARRCSSQKTPRQATAPRQRSAEFRSR